MAKVERPRVITQAMREKYGLYSACQDEHFKQKVRAYLVSEELTATTLSRLCDFKSEGAISEMLRGGQFIRPPDARIIARVMEITEQELVGAETSCPEPALSLPFIWDAPRVTALLDAIGQKRQTQRRLADEIDAILTNVEMRETEIATLETEIDYLLLEVSARVKGQDWIPDGEHHPLAT